jgi:hypothetical protein
MFYLAAAVSDFFLPEDKMVRLPPSGQLDELYHP